MTEMRSITFDNGIKRIAIRNQYDEVVGELRINVADNTLSERFANIIQNLEAISEEHITKRRELKEKYPDGFKDGDSINTDAVIELCREDTGYIERYIGEIESVFGTGAVRAAFSDAYAMNPDFVPDGVGLLDFIDSVIPVMSDLLGERFERYRKKYSVKRNGKQRTKQELIDAYRK